MKTSVKVIGFNKHVVDSYIKEAKEVEYLDKEINKKRIFGWKPQSIVNKVRKAVKWSNNGWFVTPQMRHYLEANNLY